MLTVSLNFNFITPNADIFFKPFKLVLTICLCKKLYRLFLCRSLQHDDNVILDLIMNRIMINLNMLGSSMECKVRYSKHFNYHNKFW